MRKLIAGMKVSVDGMFEGPEGVADWVTGWSDDYGLTERIDACLLGAGMFPGYEHYWSAIRSAPDKPLPMTGQLPTAGEVDWVRFAARTPHYVLSSTLTSAQWPMTSFLRGLDEVAKLKEQSGKDIYLVGGARTTASLIDAGMVDELRLIVYPLISAHGRPLFAAAQTRRGLELHKAEPLRDGRLSLIYGVTARASEAVRSGKSVQFIDSARERLLG